MRDCDWCDECGSKLVAGNVSEDGDCLICQDRGARSLLRKAFLSGVAICTAEIAMGNAHGISGDRIEAGWKQFIGRMNGGLQCKAREGDGVNGVRCSLERGHEGHHFICLKHVGEEARWPAIEGHCEHGHRREQ